MKKGLILLLAALLLLSGCGGQGSSSDAVKYADQDAFLSDMAKGITQRLNSDEDSSSMNAEQQANLFLKLVGYELDRIEKYQDLTFEDETFDQLAHLYISGCQTQRFAAQNYKNAALYDALWSAGRSTRAAIITELYSRYGLPITSEQAANYTSTGSYTITFSSGSGDNTDYTDCVKVETLPVWNEHYSNADYYHYDLLITNKSADCSIDVTVSVVFYNKSGDVVGTDRETIYAIGKGETQFCSFRTDAVFSRAEYKIEKAEKSYYTSGMSDLSFTVTTPGKKVMVEATNNGSSTIEYGAAYCIFFNGKDIVDVEYAFYSTSNDPMKPGETQYAECSTRAAYTRFEVYYYARINP